MLVLNERVRYGGDLCQVVAITPAGGNTMYKLKHCESDKVLDADFLEEDLERVDPEEAAEEQKLLLEAAKERLVKEFGPEQLSASEIRDRKLELVAPKNVKLPVREDRMVTRTDGPPREPLAPGLNDNVESRIGGQEDDAFDYSNPDGSTTAAGEAAEAADADHKRVNAAGTVGPVDPYPLPMSQGQEPSEFNETVENTESEVLDTDGDDPGTTTNNV